MCLIVASQTGKLPDKQEMENAQSHNEDGFGIVFFEEGVLKTIYALEPKAELWPLFERVKGCPYVAHFRYATHGDVNRENAHPFQVVTGKLFVAHNGVLDVPTPTKGKSDTWHFVQRVLKPNGLRCTKGKFAHWLSKRIGKKNKLAFLDDHGTITLVNGKEGVTFDGIWYSNLDSLEEPWKWTFSTAKTPTVNAVNSTETIFGERYEYQCLVECEGCWSDVKFLTDVDGMGFCDMCVESERKAEADRLDIVVGESVEDRAVRMYEEAEVKRREVYGQPYNFERYRQDSKAKARARDWNDFAERIN